MLLSITELQEDGNKKSMSNGVEGWAKQRNQRGSSPTRQQAVASQHPALAPSSAISEESSCQICTRGVMPKANGSKEAQHVKQRSAAACSPPRTAVLSRPPTWRRMSDTRRLRTIEQEAPAQSRT